MSRRTELVYVCEVVTSLLVWFSAATFVAFASKHMMATFSFRFPFFLVLCTNSAVATIAWFATRAQALRQPPIAHDTYWRTVVPLGIVSALDVGFSNWSLALLEVAFHVILKGATPLSVMLFGLCMGVKRVSSAVIVATLLLAGGLGLVASDRLALPERPLGILLAAVSVSFTGIRWVLTQLLVGGVPSSGAKYRGPVHPLSTMTNTMPVIALGALVCVLVRKKPLACAFMSFSLPR